MFRQNLKRSSRDFLEVVWPNIKNYIGDGEIRPVECVSTDNFADDLDLIAGIDAWQIIRDRNVIRGLASRVQWGSAYNNFSIRFQLKSGAPTEFEKRLYAINNQTEGYIYPHLTIQAFIDQNGKLISAGIIETKELILFAEHLVKESQKPPPFSNTQDFGFMTAPGGNQFIYISWRLIKENNIKIITI